MKRSEAIRKLTQFLKPELKFDDNSTLFPEDVLAFIEKDLGMVPPEIREFVEIPPYNILGAGFKVAHNVHKWEEE
jgi:hypothetical protein